MTDDQADAILRHRCEGKRRFDARAARDAATRALKRGQDVQPYRCSECSSWHIGHTPSMETVATIAQAIRHRAGNDPTARAS